jgi:antitoxin component of RelBE/YafQ-DinJ toxin-antitoxin module
MTVFRCRIEKPLLDKANRVSKRLGTSTSETVRIFVTQIARTGKVPLKLDAGLDAAVLAAYGFSAKKDLLVQLLELNLSVAQRLENAEPVTPPGIPAAFPNPETLISDDCIRSPALVLSCLITRGTQKRAAATQRCARRGKVATELREAFWSATKTLALSNGAVRAKAGASSTHSIRFAQFGHG